MGWAVTFQHTVRVGIPNVEDLDHMNTWLYGQKLKAGRDFEIGPVRICPQTFEVEERTLSFKSAKMALMFKLAWGGK